MYDLIGDIHGYATELKALLTKMDYQELDGVWQHPERRVIFLGDFVDRGPEQVETVQIAKAMVEKSNALAVMGNHEFNAVCWATKDSQNPSQCLRLHTDKNLGQHKEFLEQVGEGSELHKDFVEWFKTLPIFLDLPELRVVHAC
jgi:predicted MPP superfamily phosphohydrolase